MPLLTPLSQFMALSEYIGLQIIALDIQETGQTLVDLFQKHGHPSSTWSTSMPAGKPPLASRRIGARFRATWWQSVVPTPAVDAVHPETHGPPR